MAPSAPQSSSASPSPRPLRLWPLSHSPACSSRSVSICSKQRPVMAQTWVQRGFSGAHNGRRSIKQASVTGERNACGSCWSGQKQFSRKAVHQPLQPPDTSSQPASQPGSQPASQTSSQPAHLEVGCVRFLEGALCAAHMHKAAAEGTLEEDKRSHEAT